MPFAVKSEARAPKTERNPKSEARTICPQKTLNYAHANRNLRVVQFGFRYSGFFRISVFGLRVWFPGVVCA